jgi:signal transduction histidine kinase
MKHADAESVWVTLSGPDQEGRTVLELKDDGVGFDLGRALGKPAEGHFGLRLVADQASAAGAALMVRTAPGAGTQWRLEVPR